MPHGWADGPAGVGVPQPRRVDVSAGEDRLAIRAQGDGNDLRSRHHGPAQGMTRCDVPQPDRAVTTHGEEGLAIRPRTPAASAWLPWSSGRPVGWPTPPSQSSRGASKLPVRIDRPSGPNATARAALMLQGLAQPLTGGGVPQLGRVVEAAGEEGATIGTKRHGHHIARMHHGSSEGPPGSGVPQPRPIVRAAGEDRLAVRAEGRFPHPARMLEGFTERPCGGGVPAASSRRGCR